MKGIFSLCAAVAGVTLTPASNALAQYADAVIAYDSGSGFSAGFTNATTVLGPPTSGSSINPFSPAFRNTQLVSIGAGGSITVHLSAPIFNTPGAAFGVDFMIFGNSGFVITNGNFSGGGITDGSLFGNNTGSTRVEVSADGSHWFTLNPALAPTVDGLFPSDGMGNPQTPVNPALTGANFAGLGLSGIRALYAGSAGGTGYDLGWALDANGNSVNLAEADYVRIDVLSGKSEIDAIAVVPEPQPLGLLLLALMLVMPRIVRQHSEAVILPCPAPQGNRNDVVRL